MKCLCSVCAFKSWNDTVLLSLLFWCCTVNAWNTRCLKLSRLLDVWWKHSKRNIAYWICPNFCKKKLRMILVFYSLETHRLRCSPKDKRWIESPTSIIYQALMVHIKCSCGSCVSPFILWKSWKSEIKSVNFLKSIRCRRNRINRIIDIISQTVSWRSSNPA